MSRYFYGRNGRWNCCRFHRNHTSHQVGGLFGGTLVIGLIFGASGVLQDAQDVMVLFDEWLAVLGLCSVRVLDEPSAERRLYVMTAWW